MKNVSDCTIVNLPKISDPRGNLTFLQQEDQLPFPIARVHWIYEVPGGDDRGGHAFQENQEFIIALSGSFDVEIDDGEQKQTHTLNRSYFGLYIPGTLWRHVKNFSTNAVCLTICSHDYSETDYIRDYSTFVAFRKRGAK